MKKNLCLSKILMIEFLKTYANKKIHKKTLELVCKKRNTLNPVQAVNAKRNPFELM